MLTAIIIGLASIAALWASPMLWFLMGGRLFMPVLGTLALFIGWYGLWWYLIPVLFAFSGAMIATHYVIKRGLS